MVASGGASTIYPNDIAAHGHPDEFVNYSKYSGVSKTYEYANTIPATSRPPSKEGIIRALKEYKGLLIARAVKFFLRYGGPDYQGSPGNATSRRTFGRPNSRLWLIHHPLACATAVEQSTGSVNLGAINPGGEPSAIKAKALCWGTSSSGLLLIGLWRDDITSKLYRYSSVGYVSKSGSLSDELNNIPLLFTDSMYEGIGIGIGGFFKIGNSGGMKDVITSKVYRYSSVGYVWQPVRRAEQQAYQCSSPTARARVSVSVATAQDPPLLTISCLMSNTLTARCWSFSAKSVADTVKKGVMTKPIAAWFGYVGNMANSDGKMADAKNRAGLVIPDTFEELLRMRLVKTGVNNPKKERDPPTISLSRFKYVLPAFISTISDEHGQVLFYARMHSNVFKEDIGVGSVVTLLWCKCREYNTPNQWYPI
ncbi:hypothetical protein JOM56_013296 [Amanita muscaria]